MSYSQQNTDLIEKARQASLADFFTQNGFETELSRNELHVKGYGGLYVNTETNEWYCFSQADKHGGRNAINCLTDIIGMDFKSAVEALSGANMTYLDYRKAVLKLPQAKKMVLPERADNIRKVFAYLCQTRMLDSKIISDLAHEGLLYQDKRGNAVFLHRDENGNSIGAEIQGTNSKKRYKGVAPGTSDSLFSVTIGTPTKAYVFESAIDLLSFRQLANQQKIQNSILVSMAGLKPNSLKKLSERGLQLFACVDNDEAGRNFISNNNLTQRNLNLLVTQLSTIGEDGITSRDGIYAKAAELKKSVEDKTEELNILSEEAPNLKNDIAQIRFYFGNVQNRRRLDAMGQVKLAAAKEIVQKHGIRSESDVAALEERLKLLPSYIKTVQNKIADEQTKLKRINQLADIYEKVVEGNYIDNLIREQKEQERTRTEELLRQKKG